MFGNGKTALKFNIGHYLDSATNDSEYTSNSPAARIVRTGTRNWDDRTFPVGDPRRDNKVIDCDIMNFAANGECPAATGDTLNFGQASGNITQVNQETLHGWGVRQNDWQWGLTLQHEVIPAPVGGGLIQPPVVQRAQGDRQHPARSRGLRAVHDHRPIGSAAARRRRLPDSRCRW